MNRNLLPDLPTKPDNWVRYFLVNRDDEATGFVEEPSDTAAHEDGFEMRLTDSAYESLLRGFTGRSLIPNFVESVNVEMSREDGTVIRRLVFFGYDEAEEEWTYDMGQGDPA